MSIIDNAKQSNLGNLAIGNQASMPIQKGEEPLHVVPPTFKIVKGAKTIVAGMDGGSTGTRGILFDLEDESMLENTYIIPSNNTVIADESLLIKTDDLIYDNMDSIIRPLGANDIGVGGRVLRGTKLINAAVARARVSGAKSKVEQPAFYNNILDGIGYSIVLDSVKRGADIFEEYHIILGVSLPPDAAHSEFMINKFKDRMISDFQWMNKDLGVSLKLCVKFVAILTEPEAVIKAYLAQNPDATFGKGILLLEGGGSTFGTEVLINGRSSRQLSKTFKYGGSFMHKLFMEKYYNRNGKEVSPSQAKNAIETGVLTLNNSTIDVEDLVVEIKKEMADRVFDDVKSNLFEDQMDFTSGDVTDVVYSGRSFEASDKSPSLADYLSIRFSKEMDVKFSRVDDYLIPVGNVLNAYITAEEEGVFDFSGAATDIE